MAGTNRIGIGFDGEATFEDMLTHVRFAESLGFESAWMSETRFASDAFTVLGAFSQVTNRIKLGTAVVNPYTRNPVLTAVSLATLDHISRGRVIFGIGAGSPEVLRRQGVRFRQPVKAVSDTVNIVERLLAGETVAGLTEARLDRRPARTKIPIYFGAMGPRMLELATRIGDGVLLNSLVSPDYVRRTARVIREGFHRTGKKALDIAVCVECAVSETPKAAKDLMRPTIADYLAYFQAIAKETNIAEERLSAIRSAVIEKGVSAALALIDDTIVDSLTVAGTEDEFIPKLEEYAEAGADMLVVFPHGSKNEIERTVELCGRYMSE